MIHRRATTPERQLAAVSQIAAQLEHQWGAYLATVAAMGPPLMKAAAGNPGRPSGHGDPTPGMALATEHHNDTLDAITAWLAQGKWISDRVLRTLAAEGPRVAIGERERRAALCSDPVCAEYAIKLGMCSSHYNAAYYAARVARRDDSTEPVLDTRSRDTSASVEGTCGKCGTVVRGVTVSTVHELLVAHHNTDCPAR